MLVKVINIVRMKEEGMHRSSESLQGDSHQNGEYGNGECRYAIRECRPTVVYIKWRSLPKPNENIFIHTFVGQRK